MSAAATFYNIIVLTSKITVSFQGVAPESPVRIELLHNALKIPKCKLLDLMVNSFWEQNSARMKDYIPSDREIMKATHVAERTIDYIRKRE